MRLKELKEETYSKVKSRKWRGKLGKLDKTQLTKDMSGRKCSWGGTYEETGIQDDMHGVLHCSKCNKEIKRDSESVKTNKL